jgi:hypothetical protein
MTHRRRKHYQPSRPATSAAQGRPETALPTDVATLQTQLCLSRAQCAYLHRELATTLKQGPLAPSSFDEDLEAIRAENIDLRARLTLLTRHYEDLQNRYTIVECNAHPSVLVSASMDLAQVLTRLLTLAHPDKGCQGQLASELAHELALTINAIRATLEVRP